MAKPSTLATVLAQGPSHVIPDLDLMLPSGVPVQVASELVERLLAFDGVVLLEAAPLPAAPAAVLPPTLAADPAQPPKE